MSEKFVNSSVDQHCSFCGWKDIDNSRLLIYHVGINICSTCIAKCHSLISDRGWMLPGDIEYESWLAAEMSDYDQKYKTGDNIPLILVNDLGTLRTDLAASNARVAELEKRSAGLEWVNGNLSKQVLEFNAALTAANTRLTRQSAVIEAMDAALEAVLLPWKDAPDDELRSLSEYPGVLRGEAVLVIKARAAQAAKAAMEGEDGG